MPAFAVRHLYPGPSVWLPVVPTVCCSALAVWPQDADIVLRTDPADPTTEIPIPAGTSHPLVATGRPITQFRFTPDENDPACWIKGASTTADVILEQLS